MFEQHKQVSLSDSGFGTSTSGGGLFGSTNTTSNPFGGTASLFGGSGFTANQQPGTTVKFNVSSYDGGNVAVESAMDHVLGFDTAFFHCFFFFVCS